MFAEGQALLAPCSIFLGYLLFKQAYSETRGALGSFFKRRQDENTNVRVLPFK